MYCPNCGVMNSEDAAACRMCGAKLAPPPVPPVKSWRNRRRRSQEEARKADEIRKELGIDAPARTTRTKVVPSSPAPEPPPEQTVPDLPEKEREPPSNIVMDYCPQCGRPKDESENLCEYCKEGAEAAAEAEVGDSSGWIDNKPLDWEAAPVELDLTKIGGVLIMISGFLGFVYGVITVTEIAGQSIPGSVVCFTSLMTLFGMAAIAGGFSALGKKNAIFAILGGVFGILSIGFYVGALVGLVGLVLVFITYDDFEEREFNLKLQK